MRQDIKAKWVEALRSGQYQQIHGRLRYHAKFWTKGTPRCCAVGVLCDVLVSEGLGKWVNYGPSGSDREREWYETAYEGPDGSLKFTTITRHTMVLAGMNDAELGHVLKLNDTVGLRFDEIADRIEGGALERADP
jgi:hypothetical protein